MDYQLKSLGKTCAATGKPLAPGGRCMSVVVERNGQLERLDFSLEGWTGPPADTVGQWQCVVPEPEARRTAVVDPEAMLRYFEQLVEDANAAQEKLAYVLALFLLQKRRVRLDGSRAEGDFQFLQLSGTRGEGPWEIRDQQLSGDEVGRLQTELNQHLECEWNAA